jgi:hypothetical protein
LAIPFTPIALAALRYGAVAALSYALARNARPQTMHPAAEAAMDRMPEGVKIGHAPGQMNATARLQRSIRLGSTGPGLEFDLGALARLRLRRIA